MMTASPLGGVPDVTNGSGDSLDTGSNSIPDWAEVRTHDQLNGFGSSVVDQVNSEFGLTGLGQTVVVIDTGIAYDHYALGGGLGSDYRVVGGWDFAENDADPFDDGPTGYHGTHVAGIIGSSDSRYTGVASGVDLVALRVFDDHGNGNFDWIESALQWVHDHRDDFEHPITTVNMSLGIEWNETTVPHWAMLEDELAQLEQDGIFTAVSAGNSFEDYGTPGLSYPAASEHVVPVASYGGDGLLSDFSQRSDRVLVAPGERVVSTAPDYISGFDGVTDDFTTSSGTSMAAPYLAGASTLVREAFELAGRSVDQDSIYEHLVETADSIFDSETGQYYNRLNLENAIASALPADDAGDSPGTARHLGAISEDFTFDGMFTSTGDQDYFQFTAGGNGTLDLAFENSDYADTQARLVDGLSRESSSALSLDVIAGQTYIVSLETMAGIGSYSANFEFTEAAEVIPDLGVVDAGQFHSNAGTSRHTLTAAHTGWLSVSATGATDGSVTLLDESGNVVANSEITDGEAQFDYQATAGERLVLETTGHSSSVDVQITNLVGIGENEVNLYATAGDDRFIVRAGTSVTISVNGETYAVGTRDLTNVQLIDGSASDEVWIFGTDGNDAATVAGSVATVDSGDHALNVTGASRYSLIGRGGDDSVVLLDTAGDDTFIGRNDFALLTGENVRTYATGFEKVTVRSIHGGDDLAMIYGSEGDDSLGMTSLFSEITYEDSNTVNATGFDRVRVFANQGGTDTATIVGTDTGEDRFIARPEAAFFSTAGFEHQARNFDTVHLFSTGSDDSVLVYDSAGDDELMLAGKTAAIQGSFFSIFFHEFEAITALANGGGEDRVISRDAAGAGRYIGLRDLDIFTGVGFRHVARDFEITTAHGDQGDSAILYADQSGSDRLVENSAAAILRGSEYTKTVSGFDDLTVVGEVNQGLPGNHSLRLHEEAASSLATQQVELSSATTFVTGDPVLRVRLTHINAADADSAAAFFLADAGVAAASPEEFQAAGTEIDVAVRDLDTRRTANEIADDVSSSLKDDLDVTTSAFENL